MISEIISKNKYYLPGHSHEGGATKETHFVVYRKRKYVLRICNDKKSESYCHEAFKYFSKSKILPNLIEENGENFLIEFIKGRDLEEEGESIKIIKKVGEILARVNNVKAKFNYQNSLHKYLEYLSTNHVLAEEDNIKIKDLLNKLSSVKLKTCLDISDLTADNFRISGEGKVYLVDIGALKPKFAGFGITKGFFQWFKTREQRKAFNEGYSKISSMKFYSGKYKLLAQIFFIIQVLYYKHLQKKDISPYIKKLQIILSGEEL